MTCNPGCFQLVKVPIHFNRLPMVPINLSRVPLQFNRIPTNPINSTKMLGEYQNLLTINHAPIRQDMT